MICSSGIGFDPVVDGTRLTFGFEGIWQGTALLYDHQTKSFWMHLTGACIEGSHKGATLSRLDTGRHTTWRDWKTTHPSTRVMARDPAMEPRGTPRQHAYFTRRSASSGASYFPSTFHPTIQARDGRMVLHSLLYGVTIGTTHRAYPFRELSTHSVVNETIEGVPVTVWYDGSARSAAAYDARADGRALEFKRDGEGAIRDADTNSRWTMDGHCVEGPFAKSRLTPVHGLKAEWYGWFAHHPTTTVFGE